MEPFTVPCALLAIAIVLASAYYSYTHKVNQKLAPKAGGGWPIIGHLRLLIGSSSPPHRVLATMADKYGPIFRISVGVNQALVISSWEMAKQCLLENDKALLGRGKSVGAELLGYDYAMFGFSPYGPFWRYIHKLAKHELLSKYRCKLLSHVMESEVRKSVRKIYDQWMHKNTNTNVPVLVDLTSTFTQLTLGLVARIVCGKKLSEEDNEEALRVTKAVRLFFDYTGSFAIGDAFPFMRWADLGGKEKDMKKCFKEMDDILQGWIEEHKRKRLNNNEVKKGFVDQDFMDVMLTALEEDDETIDADYDGDTMNKATCMAMFLGGSDTTKVTLTWVISLLLNNQKVLQRAKEELNIHVATERQVSVSDIPKLEYLQAIVKEALRLYPPAPLMSPREFSEDCIIGDYHVKSGTRLIVNVSKISSDPRVWDNPSEFRPERFLDAHKNVDVKGHHFELIPFGAGRRKCPGINFGLQMVHLSLATFLHAFEFSTQHGAEIDLSESMGLMNLKATPLQVLLNPSLSYKAYAS